MPTPNKTSLLFVKSPQHNLIAIESYLKKRGFEVHVLENLKDALLLALQLKPDFIFLAWDHPHEQMLALSQIILQTYSPQVLTYILSTKKNHVAKLEKNPFDIKLVPPISGPGLHRLITNISTNTLVPINPSREAPFEKLENNPPRIEAFIQNFDLIPLRSDDPPEISNDRNSRAKFLRTKQGPKPLHSQTSTRPFFSQKKTLTPEQQERLGKSFEKKLAQEMQDVLLTLADSSSVSPILEGVVLGKATASSSFCMIIDSLIWAGYLIVTSEYEIDFIHVEGLFNTWIQENVIKTDEHLEPLSFAITLAAVDFLDFSNQTADYTKIIVVQNKKTVLAFFSLESAQINFQIHEAQDMIEIPLTNIHPSTPIPYSLYIYLPENKKFILYSKENAQIEPHQLSRLLEKQVNNFYSPIQFERAIQKIRAEDTLQNMIQTYNIKKKDILR